MLLRFEARSRPERTYSYLGAEEERAVLITTLESDERLLVFAVTPRHPVVPAVEFVLAQVILIVAAVFPKEKVWITFIAGPLYRIADRSAVVEHSHHVEVIDTSRRRKGTRSAADTFCDRTIPGVRTKAVAFNGHDELVRAIAIQIDLLYLKKLRAVIRGLQCRGEKPVGDLLQKIVPEGSEGFVVAQEPDLAQIQLV